MHLNFVSWPDHGVPKVENINILPALTYYQLLGASVAVTAKVVKLLVLQLKGHGFKFQESLRNVT